VNVHGGARQRRAGRAVAKRRRDMACATLNSRTITGHTARTVPLFSEDSLLKCAEPGLGTPSGWSSQCGSPRRGHHTVPIRSPLSTSRATTLGRPARGLPTVPTCRTNASWRHWRDRRRAVKDSFSIKVSPLVSHRYPCSQSSRALGNDFDRSRIKRGHVMGNEQNPRPHDSAVAVSIRRRICNPAGFPAGSASSYRARRVRRATSTSACPCGASREG